MYTRWLLIVVLLVLCGTLICCRAPMAAVCPAVVELQAESPVAIARAKGNPGTTPARSLLANHLTQRDFSAPDARVLVASLTDDDVRVLAQNPQMLCLAGDKGEADLALAALIGVGIGIGAVVLLASALAMG